MKKLSFLLALVFVLSFTACENSQTTSKEETTITSNLGLAGDDFDLQALGELMKTISSTEELEKEINKEGGINNLDLDENGEVDFIKVTEYGSGDDLGYSFTAVLDDGEPEIATVEMSKTTSEVTISGNESYYGAGHNYNSRFSTTDWLLMAYVFGPSYHPYHSPYYYGYYGGYYSPYRAVPYATYSSRSAVATSRTTSTYKQTSTKPASTIKSPNKSNTSAKATSTATKKQSLANSKKSQKSFDKGKASDKGKSGKGFDKKKSTTTKKTPAKKSPAKSSRSRSSRSSGRRCDADFKTNIFDFDNALTRVDNLNVYSFEYKEQYIQEENLPSNVQVGFMAQELEREFPEAVYYKDGALMVDEVVLIPVLVKSIQELKAEVDQLKKQLDASKN